MRSPLISAWRVLQYPIGIGVAAIVSVFAGLLLLSLHVPVFLQHGLVGFLGVFTGGAVFLPGSRLAGAIVLALIGIAFFYFRFVWYDIGPASVPDAWLRFAFICAGAIIAVVTHTAMQFFSERPA